MAAAGRSVGQLRRDGQLPATADLHPGDAVLPALDQAAERKFDGLATIPGGVELLPGGEFHAEVVHADRAAGLRLGSVADRQVDDFQGCRWLPVGELHDRLL